MELPTPDPIQEPTAAAGSSLRSKLAIVGLSSVMFTGAVFGLTSLASAQGNGADTPATAVEAEPTPEDEADVEIYGDEDHDAWGDIEISPEDEALFDEFEQCLTDAGIEGLEAELEAADEAGTLTDEDFETLDEIFEECEPILDDLSEDAGFFFGDLEGCEDSVFEDHDYEDHEYEDHDYEDHDYEDHDYEDHDDIEESVNA